MTQAKKNFTSGMMVNWLVVYRSNTTEPRRTTRNQKGKGETSTSSWWYSKPDSVAWFTGLLGELRASVVKELIRTYRFPIARLSLITLFCYSLSLSKRVGEHFLTSENEDPRLRIKRFKGWRSVRICWRYLPVQRARPRSSWRRTAAA